MSNIDVKYPSNQGKLGYVITLEDLVAALTAEGNEALLTELRDALDALPA